MMRRRTVVRTLAVAAAAVGVTVAAAPAYSQILPTPPVTTPPIDIGVPGLDIGVHVPGQELGGSTVPVVPGVPGLPPGSGSAPSGGSTGGAGTSSEPPGTPAPRRSSNGPRSAPFSTLPVRLIRSPRTCPVKRVRYVGRTCP